MNTARKIVAIGGGELKMLETADIDRRIVELTGKTRPKALFVPTASGDAAGYVETFEACYGEHFGCQTRILNLIQNPPAFEKMSALVLESDLIYVGGGNTYRMMKIWRRLGLDTVLAWKPRLVASSCQVSVQARSAGSNTVAVTLVPSPSTFRVGLHPCEWIGIRQCCILSPLSLRKAGRCLLEDD